jgi:septum formation protein
MVMLVSKGRPLLLASASPRRRELLTRVGIPLVVRAVDVDEATHEGEGAADFLERVVDDKLEAALALGVADVAAVLVADTAVIAGGTILGKPEDDDASRAMIVQLSNAEHEVWTRFAIAPTHGARHVETVATKVWFRELDDTQIDAYVATGEGRDKAGAYGIQGIGAMLVRRIEGSYSNVVGLPVAAVVEAMQQLGLFAALPIGSC